jgi:predicted metal-dependent peptidase
MVDFAALGTTEEAMQKKLSKIKIKLFLHAGAAFLGSIMSQTRFIWDDSPDCDTAWTDGITIGFNPSFWLKIPDEAKVTVLAHELWHIAYQHVLRLKEANRDPEKWNIAGDHLINLMLQKSGYKFDGIQNCYKDLKYTGMGTDQIYSLLPDPPAGGGGSGVSQGASGAGKPLGGDLRPPPKGKEIEVMGKVVQAVQAARLGNQAGTIPGEILLEIDKFLNPKLPWRVLLRRFFTEQSREDYSWKRPNRRYTDDYLPSLWSEDGLTTINYYLDISGSITDQNILRFNSEVKHIKEEFNPKRLNLVTFDTRIRDVYSFDEETPFEKVVVTGRGGTDLDPVAEHILKTKPNVAVIFSDLEVDPMPSVGGIPVLWVVIGSPNATVPFGQMIHIDDE